GDLAPAERRSHAAELVRTGAAEHRAVGILGRRLQDAADREEPGHTGRASPLAPRLTVLRGGFAISPRRSRPARERRRFPAATERAEFQIGQTAGARADA